jgi:hypothetical protein
MKRLLAITTALAGLLVVWQLLPPQTPALYDGSCTPEPYRYVVNNPLGIPKPAPVSQSFPLENGQVTTTQVIADGDNSPQAQILVLAGSVKVPTGARTITLTITPEAPPAIKPAGGFVDGNVYEFGITTDAGPPLSYSESPTIVLRGTNAAAPSRTFQQFDGTSWKSIKSSSLGCADTLEAPVPTLGKFAIVAAGSSAPSHTEPSTSFPWGWVASALALLAFGAVLTWVTHRRKSG